MTPPPTAVNMRVAISSGSERAEFLAAGSSSRGEEGGREPFTCGLHYVVGNPEAESGHQREPILIINAKRNGRKQRCNG